MERSPISKQILKCGLPLKIEEEALKIESNLEYQIRGKGKKGSKPLYLIIVEAHRRHHVPYDRYQIASMAGINPPSNQKRKKGPPKVPTQTLNNTFKTAIRKGFKPCYCVYSPYNFLEMYMCILNINVKDHITNIKDLILTVMQKSLSTNNKKLELINSKPQVIAAASLLYYMQIEGLEGSSHINILSKSVINASKKSIEDTRNKIYEIDNNM